MVWLILHTDASRLIFEYKNKDGQILKDNQATKLTQIVHDGVIVRTTEITKEKNKRSRRDKSYK
jgi:hypothetical protein